MRTFCYDRSMCSHIARLFNDVGKFSMFKINLSYFPSRARLNFSVDFQRIDLKSNIKGFFENVLALSVKKLKKVLMILSSITGRGRAFLAESCRLICNLLCIQHMHIHLIHTVYPYLLSMLLDNLHYSCLCVFHLGFVSKIW